MTGFVSMSATGGGGGVVIGRSRLAAAVKGWDDVLSFVGGLDDIDITRMGNTLTLLAVVTSSSSVRISSSSVSNFFVKMRNFLLSESFFS